MDRRRPDKDVRLLSHVIVGFGAGYVIGKRTGVLGFIVAALLSTAAHEVLDAPVAMLLADLGG